LIGGVACFFTILGAKLWLIHYASNPTPFWDEWDVADFMFHAYGEGRLTIRDFFQTHNEHLIVFTRLLMLLGVEISGYWDVVLEMIVNAIAHTVVITLVVARLARVLDRQRAIFALIICGALNALPFSWENTLWGFMTQVYLLIGFSLASLACFIGSTAWSPRWWLGTALATMSFFSGASGALTLSVVIGLFLLQILCGRRAGLREWLGIAAHAALTIALVLSIPRIAGHEPLRAHGVVEFLSAFAGVASWPAKPPFGLLVYLPATAFSIRLIRKPPQLNDDQWFNLAVLGWITVQFVALPLGRANGAPVSSRYLDTLQIGIVASLVSALSLLAARVGSISAQRAVAASIALWFLLLTFWAGHDAYFHLRYPIEVRRQTAVTETNNVRGYLTTGDVSYLTPKPILDIPYPSAERLRGFLDDATIRSLLPPDLTLDGTREAVIESLKTGLLQLRYVLLGLGGLLFFAAVRLSRVR